MIDETPIFKGYSRSLMRQLKALKEALENKNYAKAAKLLNELIDDTQKNIED